MSSSTTNARLVAKSGMQLLPRVGSSAAGTDALLLYAALDDTVRYVNDANAEFRLKVEAAPIIVASTPVTATGSVDNTYLVDHTTTAAVTINLPSVASVIAGRVLHVVDSGMNASVNNIILAVNGADTIQKTFSTLTMNADGMAISLVSDGTAGWFVE